ncbi:MAG: hypothetical protein Fur006_16690 [Coleofasciculaceae cyanobacterium]
MLKKIQIKGYKSIKNMELELAPINILIGANGTGKSNFISFFKLLRWMMQAPGQLQFFFNNLADWKSLDAGHKEAKLMDIANLGDSTAQTILRLMQCCVVHQFHNTSETARIRQRWDMEDNRYLKEDAANLAPFLLRLKETEPIYYQRIVETLTQIAPFFADFVLEPINNQVIFQWRERNTDLVFSSHQASDGTLRTMALIALLLQPQNQLPDVLILDEPELGLDPYAINIIGGLINSVSLHSQVILATQSTLLIDCFEPKDIIVVERKNRQSYFIRQDASNLEDWLEEYSLSELWNKNIIGGRPNSSENWFIQN